MYKIGFIGCGNMASAMIGGMLKQGVLKKEEIIASGPTQSKMEKIGEDLGIDVTTDNKEAAKQSEIIVLSVKPQMYEKVICELKDDITKENIIVTIAAGVTMEKVDRWFGKETKIIRTMPNTPALVGEAMVGMCHNEAITQDEVKIVKELFESFGKVEEVDEKLMNAVVGVSGSSPAYVYMFIEAMADAAVIQGIPRKKAYTFAAQAVLGSAKMVLETGAHPGELKDAVCSPAGTTIEAVRELEKSGFRSSVMEAVNAASEKGKELE
ncbi:MAG: pyrroline-5-carboxylate reductase [Anaerostipes sp.]|nr:pyrroline-5-carboxylate reductase [Anaerostipes sp.]